MSEQYIFTIENLTRAYAKREVLKNIWLAFYPGAKIGVIGGNGAREMLTYDFRQAQPPLVLIDISAGSWSDALYQAPSLTALLAQLPGRGWSFA